MTDNDPLMRLLQSTDSAAQLPQPIQNLADKVQSERARQIARGRRLKIGFASVTAVAVIVGIISLRLRQPPALPGGSVPQDAALAENPRAEPGANGSKFEGSANLTNRVEISAAEIAKLRVQADSLKSQADALEHELNLTKAEQTRQEVVDEYRRQLIVDAQADAGESASDRAALIALTQGDFYWQFQQSRQPAQAAYQSVLDNFPNSQWAAVAQQRLNEIQMN